MTASEGLHGTLCIVNNILVYGRGNELEEAEKASQHQWNAA